MLVALVCQLALFGERTRSLHLIIIPRTFCLSLSNPPDVLKPFCSEDGAERCIENDGLVVKNGTNCQFSELAPGGYAPMVRVYKQIPRSM